MFSEDFNVPWIRALTIHAPKIVEGFKMIRKHILSTASVLTLLLALSSTGCIGLTVPAGSIGIASFPVPVSPYFQQGFEDLHWENLRYGKVAIMDPVVDGCAVALDPPSDDQVIRALDKVRPVSGAVPFLETTYRTNIRIVKELIVDELDDPVVIPHVGPGQIHHAHYKCTIYFTEVTRVGWPIPHTLVNEEAQEVVYIDMDHIHRVAGPGMGEY